MSAKQKLYWHIEINGIVQGVGFRPFVYRIARQMNLPGTVRNNSAGVEIQVCGSNDDINVFCERIRTEAPRVSRIETLTATITAPCNLPESFTIDASHGTAPPLTSISPDLAICHECLQEMFDPRNRRYLYPFITCTHCGPRYTIMANIPYDRPNTSMAAFAMCDDCRQEYTDPVDRRYHAQPVSCFHCGPTLRFLNQQSQCLATQTDAVRLAAREILQGNVIAVKGLGGFHLLCDATNHRAVESLRERKHRYGKPLAVMFRDREHLLSYSPCDETALQLLESHRAPIVLLERLPHSRHRPLSELVAPGVPTLGVFLAYTPLHRLLLHLVNRPVVATSANISDEPIITNVHDLYARLSGGFAFALDHDRPILNGCDDSVMTFAGTRPLMLRSGRGYAPVSFPLEHSFRQHVLATGPQQKVTIALGIEDQLVVSPHIGDLESPESLQFFSETRKTLCRLYQSEPERLQHDLHPRYMTTQWALQQGVHCHGVQHHHAHALAVMMEHGLHEPALAFVWDGTGYGTDNTLWGAETLLLHGASCERLYTIHPLRLLGGEAAVREPRRIALACLLQMYGPDALPAYRHCPSLRSYSDGELQILIKAWQKGVNAPLSTSVGRLFDAVASLCGICQKADYEGQTGLLLEALFDPSVPYPPLVSLPAAGHRIDYRELFNYILQGSDVRQSVSVFFRALVHTIEQISQQHPQLPVICTGGVFQNRVLVKLLDEYFQCSGQRLYMPVVLPPNDASIAAGQAYAALLSS